MSLTIKFLKTKVATLEKLKKLKDVEHLFEDEFTSQYLKSLENNYIFFFIEGYIHFIKKKCLDEIIELEKTICSNSLLSKKNLIIDDFCIFRIYKKIKEFGADDTNSAISYHKLILKFNKEEPLQIEKQKNSSLFYIEEKKITKFFVAGRNYCYPLKSLKNIAKEGEKELKLMLFYILHFQKQTKLWNDIKFSDFEFMFFDTEKIFNHNTKQSLIEDVFNRKIPFNLNKLDLKIAISFTFFLDFIEEKDYNVFYNFVKTLTPEKMDLFGETKNLLCSTHIDTKYKRRKIIIYNLLLAFFLEFKMKDLSEGKCYLLKDFLNMKMNLKEKISLRITSIKKLEEKHDELILRDRLSHYKGKTKIHKKFDNLKLKKEIKILKTTKEIIRESLIQKHCVASYIPRVNQGSCIIASTVYKKIRYTLEICHTPKKGYFLAQIQGYKNRIPIPKDLKEDIQYQLKGE